MKFLISGKAIATSSTQKRNWTTKSGEMKHHIINPFIHDSAKSDLLAVTCIADTCVAADVYAKVLLILGEEKAIEYAKENNIIYLSVSNKGNMSMSTFLLNNFFRKKTK